MPSALSPYNFLDRKSTRLNSSHLVISYAVFCLKNIAIRDAHVRGARQAWVARVDGAQNFPRPRGVGHGRADERGFIGPVLPLGVASFFNDTATPEIYTLSLHAALPI